MELKRTQNGRLVAVTPKMDRAMLELRDRLLEIVAEKDGSPLTITEAQDLADWISTTLERG